jgi:hypothetical protein
MSFTVVPDGTDGYQKLNPAATGDYLEWVADNFHTSATLAPTYAKIGGSNTFTQPNTFSGAVTSGSFRLGTSTTFGGTLGFGSITGNNTTRSFVPASATTLQIANTLANLINDLSAMGILKPLAISVASLTLNGNDILWTFNRDVILSGSNVTALENDTDGTGMWQSPTGCTQENATTIRATYDDLPTGDAHWRISSSPTGLANAASVTTPQSGHV